VLWPESTLEPRLIYDPEGTRLRRPKTFHGLM
jgi:hypothetical protein